MSLYCLLITNRACENRIFELKKYDNINKNLSLMNNFNKKNVEKKVLTK